MLAVDEEEESDDDDDDGDFRVIVDARAGKKADVATAEVEPLVKEDPFVKDDPWKLLTPWKSSASKPSTVIGASSSFSSPPATIPASWTSPAHSVTDSLRSEESVTDKIIRELGEMQSRIPKATSVTSNEIEKPPGLVAVQQQSVFNGMKDKSVVATVYRSPAADAQHYSIESPISTARTEKKKVGVEIGIQTELSLAIAQDCVSWSPTVKDVDELVVQGVDAKIELAVRAQERDELPQFGNDSQEQEEEQSEGESDEEGCEDRSAGLGVEVCVEEEESGTFEISRGANESSRTNDDAVPVPDSPLSSATSVASRVEEIESQVASAEVELVTADAAEGELLVVDEEVPVPEPHQARKFKKGAKIIGNIDSGKCDLGCEDHGCNDLLSAGPKKPRKMDGHSKVKMRRGITMDTGAHHNVMPRRMIGRRRIRPSPGSRAGMKYVAAGGAKIMNEGEVDMPFESLEGHRQSMVFQIAEVNKPLGSVAYFVDDAFRVVYDKNMKTGEDLSYMIHKPTRTVYRFRRERNIWIMDAIVDVEDLYGDFSRPE